MKLKTPIFAKTNRDLTAENRATEIENTIGEIGETLQAMFRRILTKPERLFDLIAVWYGDEDRERILAGLYKELNKRIAL